MQVGAWPCGNTGDEARNCMEITGEETFQQNLEGRAGRHLVVQGIRASQRVRTAFAKEKTQVMFEELQVVWY